MSDCITCPVEEDCHYPYKPCDCVNLRKFWAAERRRAYDDALASTGEDCKDLSHKGKNMSCMA